MSTDPSYGVDAGISTGEIGETAAIYNNGALVVETSAIEGEPAAASDSLRSARRIEECARGDVHRAAIAVAKEQLRCARKVDARICAGDIDGGDAISGQ